MIILETERLILRTMRSEDAEIMYDYRNDERCAKYQRGQTKDLPGIRALVEKRKNDVVGVDAPFMVAVALRCLILVSGELRLLLLTGISVLTVYFVLLFVLTAQFLLRMARERILITITVRVAESVRESAASVLLL